MDGLDEFEKALAAEESDRKRAAQAKQEKENGRRHRQHHGGKFVERSHDGVDKEGHMPKQKQDRSASNTPEDRHRHKRPRHSKNSTNDSAVDMTETASVHRHSCRRPHRHHRTSRSSDRSSLRRPLSAKAEDRQSDDKTEDLVDEPQASSGLERDAWMIEPPALGVDYAERRSNQRLSTSAPTTEAFRILHDRELNASLDESQESGLPAQDILRRDYKFGDAGSLWRMTRLKAVYMTAEQSSRSVDEVALGQFGSLREFDDAREEKIELERKNTYGASYVGKERPTGDLFRERQAELRQLPELRDARYSQEIITTERTNITTKPLLDQTALNRLRALMMKARLKNAPNAAHLEMEYNSATATFASSKPDPGTPVVLGAQHTRLSIGRHGESRKIDNKCGRRRGLVQAHDDMSVEDMVSEERRTRSQPGGESMRLAERIAKDAKFDDDTDYLDENAEKLAKRVYRSEASLKNMAVTEFRKLNCVLDNCPLCHHEDRDPPRNVPVAPIVSLATRVFLTLPVEPEIKGAEGGAVIVPISHHKNLLECDDDEWEEIRNFMKSLTRFYHNQGRDVLFYENAAAPERHPHAALVAVPIPYEFGDTAPAFFREAILSADDEWSQHKKIIDTSKRAQEGLGKLAFRRSMTKEMPYFHVWFNLDGGIGHVVENSDKWPKGDLFARGVVGGMVGCEFHIIQKQGQWGRSVQRLHEFKKRWRTFDWSQMLEQ